MAKKFNSVATVYVASGKFVNRETFELCDFEVASTSRIERNIKKLVADTHKCSMRDVLIQNVEAHRTVHSYKVNANLEQILAACRAAGIEVVDLGVALPDDDTTDDTDTDNENDA